MLEAIFVAGSIFVGITGGPKLSRAQWNFAYALATGRLAPQYLHFQRLHGYREYPGRAVGGASIQLGDRDGALVREP